MTYFFCGWLGSVTLAPWLTKALADNVDEMGADGLAGCANPSEVLPLSLDGSEIHRQPLGGRPKRAFDVALAAAMLILLAPIMLTVTALVGVFMGAPIIFAHRRIGFNGKAFVCYKFRTMPVNAEELLRGHLAADPKAAREWRERRKLLNDPRVNCLGRVLRKSSLDELPQLFNVLRGDMSLIGPRPIVSDELKCYGRHAQAYLKARPGLTGVWRTSGQNRVDYAARVARDRYYFRHWSLWLDIVLLLKTMPAVLNFDQTA